MRSLNQFLSIGVFLFALMVPEAGKAQFFVNYINNTSCDYAGELFLGSSCPTAQQLEDVVRSVDIPANSDNTFPHAGTLSQVYGFSLQNCCAYTAYIGGVPAPSCSPYLHVFQGECVGLQFPPLHQGIAVSMGIDSATNTVTISINYY